MKMIEPKLLQEIVDRLVNEFHPEQIFLFGSHAWGVPTEDSDLDLLVIVSHSDESPTARATRALRALGRIMAPLDVIVKTCDEVEHYLPLSSALTRKILEKGKLLYGNQPLAVGA